MDLTELQAERDAAAEAVGAFEAEWAPVDAEWRDKRRAVNLAYQEAEARLQAAIASDADEQTLTTEDVATLDQVITPEGVAAGAAAGEVGG